MSQSAGVAITTVLSILVIVDIVGNFLVCVIIKRNREMRYAKTDCIKQFTINFSNRYIFRSAIKCLSLGDPFSDINPLGKIFEKRRKLY